MSPINQNDVAPLDSEEKGATYHAEETQKHILPDQDVDAYGSREKTDPAEIRLVRKIDWIMLPTLWLMYWFNYLDRNAITVARLDGMEKELGLTSTEYQTSVSILFVGYILGQIPSSTSNSPSPSPS
jgi:hypothetical protein